MFILLDDGDNRQSLQLNLPNTSYRDIVFAGNDLVVGTYGCVSVLDDYAVVRQMTPTWPYRNRCTPSPDPSVRMRRTSNSIRRSHPKCLTR